MQYPIRLIYISIVSLWTMFMPAPAAQGASANQPEFVVSPILLDVAEHSFQVMWETSTEVKGQIHLGKAEYHILRPEFKPAAVEDKAARLHHLTVTGLEQDVLYFYQVVNISEAGDTLKGPVTPVTLPDYNQSAVSFTVVGDTQGNPKVWSAICRRMIVERPQFIIHCGDLVAYGPNTDDWVDEFFKPGRDLMGQVPLYPAIGNHEMNDPQFYRYFHLPQGDAFYSVKKGPLRIIYADTNKDLLPGSLQYRKLEQLLANCREPWKIVVHHHPVYTSGNAAYRSSLMATATKGDPNILHLKNLYETYGVDLVLNGHVHSYERSWPLWKNHINPENGVTHIITGGGGGGFREDPLAYINWFSAKKILTNHFLNIQLADHQLTVAMIDTTGKILDTWTKFRREGQPNAPVMEAQEKYFLDSTRVTIRNPNPSGMISYRLNDGEYHPAPEKEIAFTVGQTTTVSALTSEVGKASHETVKTFTRLPLMNRQSSGPRRVNADYYEGYFTLLPDFETQKPDRSFNLDSISLDGVQPRVKDHFAVRFTGSIAIPETAVYRFFLESFDGSMLLIDGEVIVNNDGVHYEIFREGYAALERGIHHLDVRFFDFERRETLNLKIGKQNGEMVSINRYLEKKGKF